MADTIKLAWAWRSKLPRAFLRSSFPFLIALSFAIASIAAGISTAFAIDSSNIEILVDSPMCGRINYTKVYENSTTSTLLAAIKATVDTYATNCYQDKPSLPEPCRNTFARTNITFHATAAPCPWNETICRGGELPALLMDAGMVDLRTQFGLNLQPQDTVKLQKKTTCSVLPIENRIVERNASWWTARGFTDTKTTIEYGTYRNTDPELRPEATFIQANALSLYQQSYGSSSIFSYLQPDVAAIGIDPIPEMRRTDADIALAAVWLNDVTYEKPVDDPLFSAHKVWIYTPGGGYPNETKYKSDFAAGVVGCAQQVWCSHNRCDRMVLKIYSTDTAFLKKAPKTSAHRCRAVRWTTSPKAFLSSSPCSGAFSSFSAPSRDSPVSKTAHRRRPFKLKAICLITSPRGCRATSGRKKLLHGKHACGRAIKHSLQQPLADRPYTTSTRKATPSLSIMKAIETCVNR